MEERDPDIPNKKDREWERRIVASAVLYYG